MIHYIFSIFIRCKRASKTDRWNSFRNRYVRICAAAFMEYRFNIQRLQTKPRGFYQWCMGILSSARTFSAQFNVGEGSEMDAISAVVLGGTSMSGGVGRLSGTIIGCIVIGVLNNGMNILGIDSSWQYVVKGVVVLIAVFIDYIKKMKD